MKAVFNSFVEITIYKLHLAPCKVYNSVVFSTFTDTGNHHEHKLILDHFYHPEKKIHTL